jgi:SAM-dependent methyltransferase
MDRSVPCDTRAAYDALAPVYDGLTAHHDHEGWLAQLLGVAGAHGLAGRRLLDVACGTGKSFMPLVRRGFDVTACDISPRMAARARRRARGQGVRVHVADMRRLPVLCEAADLVTCLDDAVNYLLDVEDLIAAFASVARLLAPDGIYLFDTNTLATYRAGFAADATFERPLAAAVWRGETTEPIRAGALCSAAIELASNDGGAISRHVQRHHPESVIRQALTSAGLACRAVLGQSTGGVLHEVADEDIHTKLVYVVGRAA